MSPIGIVLSVYIYMFAKGALFWLYGVLSEMIFGMTMSASDNLDGNSFTGAFSSIQIYAVYNIGEMILLFLSLFIAYNIIFHFYDWLLEYFGHKGQSGLGKGMESVFTDLKQKTMSKV